MGVTITVFYNDQPKRRKYAGNNDQELLIKKTYDQSKAIVIPIPIPRTNPAGPFLIAPSIGFTYKYTDICLPITYINTYMHIHTQVHI
jgi:hypothetical protein